MAQYKFKETFVVNKKNEDEGKRNKTDFNIDYPLVLSPELVQKIINKIQEVAFDPTLSLDPLKNLLKETYRKLDKYGKKQLKSKLGWYIE